MNEDYSIFVVPDNKLIKLCFEDDVSDDGLIHQKSTLEEVYNHLNNKDKKKLIAWCKKNPHKATRLSCTIGW